jgi:hypothetical protein
VLLLELGLLLLELGLLLLELGLLLLELGLLLLVSLLGRGVLAGLPLSETACPPQCEAERLLTVAHVMDTGLGVGRGERRADRDSTAEQRGRCEQFVAAETVVGMTTAAPTPL